MKREQFLSSNTNIRAKAHIDIAPFIVMFLATWTCFLPVPGIERYNGAVLIAAMLSVYLSSAGLQRLSTRTAGSWCYWSVLALPVFAELVFTVGRGVFETSVIADILLFMGPFLAVVVLIRTPQLLRFTILAVMLFVSASALFGILTYYIGGPFVRLKFYIFDISDLQRKAEDLSGIGLVSGLRGSAYMFGYDIAALFGMSLALFVFARNVLGFLNPLLVRLAALITLLLSILSMHVNGERMPAICACILVLHTTLIHGYRRYLFILVPFALIGILSLSLEQVGEETILSRFRTQTVEKDAGLRVKLLEAAQSALSDAPLDPHDTYLSDVVASVGVELSPHVHFLTVLIQYGVLALPILLYVLYRTFRTGLTFILYVRDPFSWMIYFAFLAYILNGITHNPGPWIGTPSAVFLLALLGKHLELMDTDPTRR